MASQASEVQVQKLYIAYFGRPADRTGLDFYADALDAGTTSVDAIATSFGNSPEAAPIVALSAQDFVEALYMQAFGRAYDESTDGTFWVDAINSGATTKELAFIQILDGATGADVTAVNNKVEVAQTFTAAVEVDAYVGADAAAAAKAVLDDVTADPVTVTTGNDAAAAAAADLNANVVVPGVPGDTITLTADVDALTGTANDDTFDGSLTVGSTPSFTNIDSIDGAEGTDTLNATFNGTNATDFSAGTNTLAANVQNVENFYLRSLNPATDVDFAGYQGAEQIWSNRSSQALVADNVANAVTVGMVAGSGSIFTVNYANALAATATQNIALDDADGTIAFAGVGIANVRNIAISNTGDSELTLTDLTGANLQNLTITGDGSLELDAAQAITAGVIDASAATADITLTVGDAAATNQAADTDRDVTLGAGDDVVDVSGLTSLAANVDSVDGGEGNDTLVVDGSSITIAQDVLDKSSNFEVLQLNGYNLIVGAGAISASILNNVGYEDYVFQDAASGVMTNISASNTIGLVNTDATADAITLDLASGVTDLSVSAENDDATANNEFFITTNAGSVTVDFVANADSNGVVLALDETTPADDELTSVTITGEEDVTFDATETTISTTALDDLETVDASGLDGDAVITVGEGVTVTTGAGDDTITASVDSVVTGGAGDDTFVVSTGAGASLGKFVTITDFEAGDVIDFGTAVGAVAEITESDIGLAPGVNATFADYVSIALGSAVAGDVSYFEFGGDTYLVHDVNANASGAIQADDILVKLTGSVDLSDLAANGNTVEIA